MEIVESTIVTSVDLASDEQVALALEKNPEAIDIKVKESRGSSIASAVAQMSLEDHHSVLEGLKESLGDKLSVEDFATLSRLLSV